MPHLHKNRQKQSKKEQIVPKYGSTKIKESYVKRKNKKTGVTKKVKRKAHTRKNKLPGANGSHTFSPYW